MAHEEVGQGRVGAEVAGAPERFRRRLGVDDLVGLAALAIGAAWLLVEVLS